MTEQTNQNTELNAKNLFSILYRTRVKARKGETTIANVSVLFTGIALLTAPWVVIGGAVTGAVMGYRFTMEKNAKEFSSNMDDVFRNAADSVKATANTFTENGQSEQPEDAEMQN